MPGCNWLTLKDCLKFSLAFIIPFPCCNTAPLSCTNCQEKFPFAFEVKVKLPSVKTGLEFSFISKFLFKLLIDFTWTVFETIAATLEEYTKTTTTSNIADINYKGKRLRIDFTDGSGYEYYGVPENTFSKLINADSQGRFARRHIYTSFLYRNVSKLGVTV